MALSKISDSKLLSENRYHVTQEDVPGKSAKEMKEFMDYVPRSVIIPKLNEVIDEVENKADSDSVYKTTETYNKEETDTLLDKKADSDNTYTVADVNKLLSYKVNGDSDKVILDVATLPDSDDVSYGVIYRYNGSLYTKDTQTGEFTVINKTPELTDGEDVINDVNVFPECTGDTLGRLYRYKGKLYESVILESEKFSGDITYSHLDPLWCRYNTAEELKAYLDTLEFDPIGDDGEYSSLLLFTMFYGVDENEEYIHIKKHAGYADGYILQSTYVSGGEWSLEEWVNGHAYIGRWIVETTGCSKDTVSVMMYDTLFENLTIKREYGYSPVANENSVGKMAGFEFVQSVTVAEDSDTVDISANTAGEDLSVYRELFVLFTGTFKTGGTMGVRVTNGGDGNFYVYNNFTVTADSNYGWWFKLEKIAECYDAVNDDTYSLKKCEYAGTMLNGFSIANSIHSQGTMSKSNVNCNISCIQSRLENDSMIRITLPANQFGAGAVFKVFGRRR